MDDAFFNCRHCVWLLRGAKFLELSGDLAMSTAHRFSGDFGSFLARCVAHLLSGNLWDGFAVCGIRLLGANLGSGFAMRSARLSGDFRSGRLGHDTAISRLSLSTLKYRILRHPVDPALGARSHPSCRYWSKRSCNILL